MITVPEALLREVDATARDLKQNRSELIRQALTGWIQQIRTRQFEELMAEGYQESAEHTKSVAHWAEPLQAMATEGNWTWDE